MTSALWGGGAPGRRDLLPALLVAAGLVIVFVVAAVLAGDSGYRAIGDDAEHAIHARDILSTHPPLLGMPSSISDYVDGTVYHPGPLLFIVDLPGVRLLGPAAGLLVTVAVVNIAAVAAIAFVGERLGGRSMMTVALIVTLATYLACGGPAGLYKPLNPFVVTLPLLLFLFLACGLAAGHTRMLPAAIVVGSLVVQANVSFAPTLAAVMATALGLLWAQRGWRITWLRRLPGSLGRFGGRARRRFVELAPQWITGVFTVVAVGALLWAVDDRAGLAWLTGWAVVGVVSALVVAVRRLAPRPRSIVGWSIMALVVCWCLPLWQALTNEGGNLRALAEYATGGGPRTAPDAAEKILALAFGPPVEAIRDGFSPELLLDARLWGVLLAIAVAIVAFARPHPQITNASRMVVIAGVAGLATALGSGRAPEFDTSYFWVPLLSCVLWAGLLLGLHERFRPRVPTPPIWALAVVAVLVALPLVSRPWPLAAEEPILWAYPAMRDLGRDLEALPTGTYALVTGAGKDVDEVVLGLTAELDAQGQQTSLAIDSAGFDDERLYRQGQDDVDGLLSVLPRGVEHPPPGARLMARYVPEGWDEAEVEDLASRLRAHLRDTQDPIVTDSQAEVAIYGRVEGACLPGQGAVLRPGSCVDATPYSEDPSRLYDLDPAILLDLYRAGMQMPGGLPADLAADLEHAPDLLALDVWLSPPPAP